MSACVGAAERIARRLRRLRKDARAAGLLLVADASGIDGAVRIMTREELDSVENDGPLPGLSVDVDGALQQAGILAR